MNGKIIIKILMILLIILISLLFYLKYFSKSPKKLEKNETVEKINIDENNSSTFIENINYVSSDIRGNKYQITAAQAEIQKNKSDIMFLKNIEAYIIVKDSDIIKVTSDFGKYDAKNFDTIFSENVTITHPNHRITGEYLDFSFLNNLGTISTNVIYTSNDTNLFADKVEMNLVNKDIKIFMNDDTKKVLLEVNK